MHGKPHEDKPMTPDNFDKSLAQFVEGNMTPVENEAFLRLLRENPDLARRVIAELDFISELELAKGRTSREFADAVVTATDLVRVNTAPTARSFWSVGSWKALVPLAVAAILLVTVGVWQHMTPVLKNEGNAVATGRGQTMALRFEGEDTVLEVAENTTLRLVGGAVVSATATNMQLVKSGPQKVIEIESGSIRVSAAKQIEGRSFAVRSVQAELTVVGTVFSVSVRDEATRLMVEEGVVRMRLSGKSAWEDIGAGSVAVARMGQDRIGHPGRLIRSVKMGPGSRALGVAFEKGILWACVKEETGKFAFYRAEAPEWKAVRKGELVAAVYPMMPGLAWDGKSLWTVLDGTEDVWVLGGFDPESGALTATKRLPLKRRLGTWPSFDLGAGYLWVGQANELLKIDANDMQICGRFRCPWSIGYIGCSEKAVYAGRSSGPSPEMIGRDVVKLDAADGRVLSSYLMSLRVFRGDLAAGTVAGYQGDLVAVADATDSALKLFEAE
ncbi:MAG: hypothetical protein C0404_06505 [Verrucomicrobia bacterium]|nr:hypothetical protein [Verrucomicrobiota bacterium]